MWITRERWPWSCTTTSRTGRTSCRGPGRSRSASRSGATSPASRANEELVDGQPTTEPADRVLGLPINYSSGTTGQPKAVDPAALARRRPVGGRRSAPRRSATPSSSSRSTGVHLVSAGMHHGGCQGFYLGALNVGQAVAILGKFDPEATLDAIARAPRHHRVHGPDAVRPVTPAAPGCEGPLRRLEPGGRRPLGRAVPARGQEADDGVVGARHLGDVRRHGGRGHHRQAATAGWRSRARSGGPSPA